MPVLKLITNVRPAGVPGNPRPAQVNPSKPAVVKTAETGAPPQLLKKLSTAVTETIGKPEVSEGGGAPSGLLIACDQHSSWVSGCCQSHDQPSQRLIWLVVGMLAPDLYV
jgi:hypothetical protein